MCPGQEEAANDTSAWSQRGCAHTLTHTALMLLLYSITYTYSGPASHSVAATADITCNALPPKSPESGMAEERQYFVVN